MALTAYLGGVSPDLMESHSAKIAFQSGSSNRLEVALSRSRSNVAVDRNILHLKMMARELSSDGPHGKVLKSEIR